MATVTKGSPLIAVIVGLLFFGIGAYFSYSEYVATTWDSVQGNIESSKVASYYDSDDGHYMYRPAVKYNYSYRAKDYIGSCCSISSSDAGGAQRFIDSHEAGQTTDVYVDPENPYQSRLKDDVNPFEILFVAFMGIGGIVALFGAYMAIKSMKQKEMIG